MNDPFPNIKPWMVRDRYFQWHTAQMVSCSACQAEQKGTFVVGEYVVHEYFKNPFAKRSENTYNVTNVVPVKNRLDTSKLRYLAGKLEAANERMNEEAHNPERDDIAGVAFVLEMMAIELEQE